MGRCRYLFCFRLCYRQWNGIRLIGYFEHTITLYFDPGFPAHHRDPSRQQHPRYPYGQRGRNQNILYDPGITTGKNLLYSASPGCLRIGSGYDRRGISACLAFIGFIKPAFGIEKHPPDRAHPSGIPGRHGAPRCFNRPAHHRFFRPCYCRIYISVSACLYSGKAKASP